MKVSISVLFVPLLLLLSGCASHGSTGYGYGHRGHVSVGGHGHGSGAAVAGALIVGGIIGTVIADSKNEQQRLASENANAHAHAEQHSENNQDELVNGYPIDNSTSTESDSTDNSYPSLPIVNRSDNQDTNSEDYNQTLAENSTEVQWYQVGKDGLCYLMSVDNGVTDIVSAVPSQKCEPKQD